MESVSPLANLLEGVHNQRRNQVDEAMTQIRTLLHPSALQLVLDGSPAGLSEVIRLVLARHPELACIVKRDDGSLPLHHAASLGDIPIAELLLATFPEAAIFPNKKGKIPLHFAAREGRTELVRFFLYTNPITARIPSKKNKLALHFAAGEGHLDIVLRLLELFPQGSQIKSAKGKLPLHFAARWGHLEVAKVLLRIYPEGIQELDVEGSLPLHDAAREGQVRMCQFLFYRHPRGLMTANIRQEIPLFKAVRSGNLDLVIPLIQAWPAGGRYVLKHACQDDAIQFWQPDILELILRGAVGNFTNCSLLDGREAPPLCNGDSVVHSGGDETESDSECSTASLTSEEEAIMNLEPESKKVPRKRPPEQVSTYDSQPRKRSRARSMTKCCEFIALHAALEGGANAHVLRHTLELFSDQVTKQDGRGRLPLHVAMTHCHGESTADLILEKILKPFPDAASIKDDCNCLPLHIGLVHRANFRLIEGLLEANPAAGFEPCGQSGKLPIHLAAEYNCDLSTVFALLRGDPSIVSKHFQL